MEQETNTSRDNVGCIISVVEERELREKIVVSRNYKFIRPSFPRIATKYIILLVAVYIQIKIYSQM